MTAYVKRYLGGKLFTIEWTLSVVGGVADHGDFYENDGAQLLSISAHSSGLAVGLKFSNVDSEDVVMNISGSVVVPVAEGFEPAYSPVPVIPPVMRRYGVQAEAGASNDGTARIGLLFEQL